MLTKQLLFATAMQYYITLYIVCYSCYNFLTTSNMQFKPT